LVCVAALLSFLWYDYERTRVPFTVVFNGQPSAEWTTHVTVEGALLDAGLKPTSADRVEPGLTSPISSGQTISVERATPVLIEADGRVIECQTHQRTPRAVFAQSGIGFSDHDQILVSGEVKDADERLPAPVSLRPVDGSPLGQEQSPWEQPPPRPVRLVLKRAVTMYVDEGGIATPLYTTSATIGEALRHRDIILYLGDRVNPSLGSRVAPGLKVYIQRSKSVELAADGHALRTRTRGRTVADVLGQQSVSLVGSDFVQPPESTPIQEGTGIRVTRVAEARIIEQQTIPFETVWQADKDIEIDQQRLDQDGAEGLTQRRIEVVYHDGKESARRLDSEWVQNEPKTKILTYGTQIVPHELQTENGPLTYWRKVRMLATSYSPATSGSGKLPSHPRYGITFSGIPVKKGIVAVDPKVVALRSDLYVPGYGSAMAADTGGSVKGRHIDLGYSDDDLVRWYRWVDVYLLGLPPSPDQIRWVLPNWPREGR
jgi:resuscitation-promoting factor RpfB